MTIVRVNHAFVSSAAEGADATKVRTSNWNANLTLTHGPTFAANRATTDQTITASTLTEVAFNAEDFDTDAAYNPANGRFTPQVAGYYQINAKLIFSSSSLDITNAQVLLYKNGVQVRALAGYFPPSGISNSVTFEGSCLTPTAMNGTTDYLSIFAYLGTAGTAKVLIGSFFDGNFVRP